jgi:hypothetical protein
MKRPWPLTTAVVLQWVAAVAAVISAFDLMAAAYEMHRDDVATQIEGALVNQGIVDIPGSTVVNGVFVAGVLLLAIAFVRVMVAVYLGRGRDWARLVVAVFACINLVGGLGFLLQGEWVRAVVVVVIEAAILWLLFNARSSEYIREQSAARA